MNRRLNLTQRTLIERHLRAGKSLRWIAQALGRSPSTISREIARNGGKQRYRAAAAQARTDARRAGVGPPPVGEAVLRAAFAVMVRERWSPEQVANDPESQLPVSASTLRRRVRQNRANGGKLYRALRHRGKPRLSKAARAEQSCNCIPDRVHYSQRPPAANDRGEFGHWEMDTAFDLGTGKQSGILVASERASRLSLARPLRKVNAAAVAAEAVLLFRGQVVRSITMDNGGEFARHRQITEAVGAPCFFTDPGRPGQRGTCENAVALFRDLTRGQHWGTMSPRRLAAVAERLARRPMKTHQWRSRRQVAQQLTQPL